MKTTIDYKFHPNKEATIILAPFSGGQPKGGVEDGPDHILKAGFQQQLEDLGWKVTVDEPLKGTNYEAMKDDESDQWGICKRPKLVGECCKKIHDAVKDAAQRKTLPITIGGDHSIASGTVAGFFSEYPDACLLWIDAHADINTPKTTESGNLHGCPVSFVMGLDADSYPPQLQWIPHVLSPKKIAYIGLRDVDDGEKKILRDNNIAAFSMYHVDKYGIGKVVEMALKAINPDGDLPVHVSYDVDAIDPSFVPATGTRVQGGLSLREGLFIVEEVAATGNLAALDIVETNPALAETEDHVMDTVGAACAIGRCAMGETLL